MAQNSDFVIPANHTKEKLDPHDIAAAVLYILQTATHLAVQDIILRSIQQYD